MLDTKIQLGNELSIVLDERSKYLRGLVLRALKGGERGHIGSSLSLIEIIRVLYDEILTYDAANPLLKDRDRFILSKGHGCIALYAILADKGFFEFEHLDSFCRETGMLGGHPEMKTPGVEAATGALGHGLSIGVGMALAARVKKQKHRVFVAMGDGEINEGSVWEAAMSASKHKLSNLTAILDYNKIQSYSFTKEVLDLEPLQEKWEAFGFSVQEVNGHDVTALKQAFNKQDHDRPNMVICHTVKGKGISYAENDPSWHHKSKLLPEDIQALYSALEAY